MRLQLLGPMQAHSAAGDSVLPRGRKARAVLAVLALSAPRPVARDFLWRLLWSSRQPEQGRASLRQSLHELHACLLPLGPDILRIGRGSVSLNPDRAQTDLRFLSQVAPDDAAADACAPVELGRLLADLAGLDPAFERWREAESERLRRTARAAAEAALSLQTGYTARLAAAERLLAIQQDHEPAWRAMIDAHIALGDRAAALAAYERCTTVLADLAGRTPAAETCDLLARLRAPSRTGAGRNGSGQSRRGVRLGVAPLRALDGHDAALSLGLADEITASLARFRWIATIAGRTSGDEPDALEPAGRDVDFLLDGTLQRGGGRVRVLVRLLDQRAEGEVVWAHRFDRCAADLLNVQDEIAAEIAAQVDPELLLREGARAAGDSAADPSAYQLVLKAVPAIYRLDEGGFRRAGDALQAAVARDPGYAAAHAWWACWHVFLAGQGWADAADAARAAELAERAVALDPADARALTIAGHVRGFLQRHPDEAAALHDRALALNPNLPMAWVFSGLGEAYAGRHEEALRRIRSYQRLSRFDPHGFFYETALMVPHLFRGEHEEVEAIARKVAPLKPGFASTLRIQLAALGHLGRAEAAAEVRGRLLRLEPRFSIAETIARTPLARAQDRALYAEGLRRAGLPE